MPSHWESSERPLFVKTVIVNGNRHAILSQMDPLLQTRRSDNPCNNCPSSMQCLNIHREDLSFRRARSCYPSKRDISTDLQDCLVKLRVELGTQDNKKKMKREVVYVRESEKWKSGGQNDNWKHLKKNLKKIKKRSKSSNCSESSSSSIKELKEDDDIRGFRKGNIYETICGKAHEDITEIIEKISDNTGVISEVDIEDPEDDAKTSDRTNIITKVLPLTETAEQIIRNYSNYFFPIVYIKAWDNDITKNPLSDRVMQWLDLARKRQMNKQTTDSITNGEKNNTENNKKALDNNIPPKPIKERCPKNPSAVITEEDVEEEVKQESDIETVLSSATTHEYPKFSKDLNKNHIIKEEPVVETDEPYQEVPHLDDYYWESSLISIPEKANSEFSVTEQLQQSILSSFEAIVSLDRRAESNKMYSTPRRKSVNTPTKVARRKGLLLKQASIRMSSDEDEAELKQVRKKGRKSSKDVKKFWDHKRRYKYLGQRLSKVSNDENEEPNEESIHILYNERPLNMGKNGRWDGDYSVNKPQLHIFMPGIDSKLLESQEESASDTESFSK